MIKASAYPVEKLISGGQTGVDRAALDIAISLGIPCGGWCPRGRRSEDGTIPIQYPLRETPSDEYEERTSWNIRDSDATLVLSQNFITGGTSLTLAEAQAQNKPCLVLSLKDCPDPQEFLSWLHQYEVRVLNIAGPRESEAPGIYQECQRFLRRSFLLLEPYYA